jgi:hypothetical protein
VNNSITNLVFVHSWRFTLSTSNQLETVFVVTAFLIQIVLIIHFAVRKWRFDAAMRYGRIVYALSIPAVLASCYLLRRGMQWSFWIGGFLYLAWAAFGYAVEYRMKIQWRSPMYVPIFVPYISLYLAMIMFYWWPLAVIHKQLWYWYAVLFVVSTILNLASHKKHLITGNTGLSYPRS